MSQQYPVKAILQTCCSQCGAPIVPGELCSFVTGGGVFCTKCVPLPEYETHVKVAKPTPKPLSPDEYTILMGIAECLKHCRVAPSDNLKAAAAMAGVEDYKAAIWDLLHRDLIMAGEPNTCVLTQKGACLVGMLHAQRR